MGITERKEIATAHIRKDGFNPSRPWVADLDVGGKLWVAWAYGFRTRKALLEHLSAVGGIKIAAQEIGG